MPKLSKMDKMQLENYKMISNPKKEKSRSSKMMSNHFKINSEKQEKNSREKSNLEKRSKPIGTS